MKQTRCANCTISLHGLKKAGLSDQQEVLNLLRKWHPKRRIEEAYSICMGCLTLIEDAMELGNTDKPVLGHHHPCPVCGKSLKTRKVRPKTISLDNVKEVCIFNVVTEWILPEKIEPTAQICRCCWLKASRYLDICARREREEEKEQEEKEKEENEQEKEQNQIDEIVPQAPETIILPNYKRAVATENSQCVFSNCKATSITAIPMRVRKKLLVKYCYYLLPSCKICKKHLDRDFWETVVDKGVKIFTAEHIEDMIEVLKSDNETYD